MLPISLQSSALTLPPCRLVKTSAEIDAASAQGLGMQNSGNLLSISWQNSGLTLHLCRLVKTSAEIDAASAQGLGMQKSSRDFIKRVAAVSGITSACGVPERAQHVHTLMTTV